MAHPATSFATEVYLLARRHLDNIAAGGGDIPENTAAHLLADGDIALRGLHDKQRGANIHRRQRLQFLINNLATLLVRVGHAAVVTGAGLQPERVKWGETKSAFASRIQCFNTKNAPILQTTDLDSWLTEYIKDLFSGTWRISKRRTPDGLCRPSRISP